MKDATVTIPTTPKSANEMSKTELDAKLAHSYDQSLAGEGRLYQDVFDELEKELL